MSTATAVKKSRAPSRRVRFGEVGRRRKYGPDEDTILSFRVAPELREGLDDVVTRVNREQPGRSMSRTELIKIVLHDWLKRGAKLPK